MNLFLSWSKERSRSFATFLHGWLPSVIQRIEPWMSSQDIDKGQRWGRQLSDRLASTAEGIICVTAENMSQPWLNFEAGSLAKAVGEARVRPVLLGVKPTDLTGPLAQFQSTSADDREDMYRLMVSLNKSCDRQLEPALLEGSFDRAWAEFGAMVAKLTATSPTPPAKAHRSTDEKIDEILSLVRTMHPHVPTRGPARNRQTVLVDLREIDPGLDLITFADLERESVDTWLNDLYLRFLQNRLPPFSYGVTWVLVDERRGIEYFDMGRTWARNNGLHDDGRSPNQAGIASGSILTVKLLDAEPGQI